MPALWANPSVEIGLILSCPTADLGLGFLRPAKSIYTCLLQNCCHCHSFMWSYALSLSGIVSMEFWKQEDSMVFLISNVSLEVTAIGFLSIQSLKYLAFHTQTVIHGAVDIFDIL